jgi:uncharacterized SAM-binding protein YcdF (DUF218 family)
MNKNRSLFHLAFCTLLLCSCQAYYHRFYADPDQCFELAKTNKPYDAIIVPGYPYDPKSANGILKERLVWANYLYQNGYAKNVIFSGSAVHSPYVEAEVMRLLALQLGIPDSHIFLETKAEHTTENLYYSQLLAKKLGFQSVAFATQPAQASYMKVFNRKWDLHVEMLPVVTSFINPSAIHFQAIDTSATKIPGFVPLRERESMIKSLRGTRGHRVKVERRKWGAAERN